MIDELKQVVIFENGVKRSYPLSHLRGLRVTIKDLKRDDLSKVDVNIEVHPSNHLYSRKKEDEDNLDDLNRRGAVFYRPISQASSKKETRIFCKEKYMASQFLKPLIMQLNKSPEKKCILANKYDKESCFSAVFDIKGNPNEAYLIIFKLKKVNSKKLIMSIDTGFLSNVNNRHPLRVLKGNKSKELLPFSIIVRNVLQGRRPFDGIRRSKNSVRNLKKKKRRALKKNSDPQLK